MDTFVEILIIGNETSASQITKMLLPEYIPKWVPRGVNDKIGYLCVKDIEDATPGFNTKLPPRGGRGLKSKIDF